VLGQDVDRAAQRGRVGEVRGDQLGPDVLGDRLLGPPLDDGGEPPGRAGQQRVQVGAGGGDEASCLDGAHPGVGQRRRPRPLPTGQDGDGLRHDGSPSDGQIPGCPA